MTYRPPKRQRDGKPAARRKNYAIWLAPEIVTVRQYIGVVFSLGEKAESPMGSWHRESSYAKRLRT